MTVIVDYGMGNIGSIKNMLSRLGADTKVAVSSQDLQGADRIILPGVGAFDHAMRRLRSLGFADELDVHAREKGTPILGICLGMQLFAKGSEEGVEPGLGWIDAETLRLPETVNQQRVRLPHMGWAETQIVHRKGVFVEAVENSRFYYVHEFYVRCANEDIVSARATYGISFHAALNQGNIHGCQFHPEKSHRFGLSVMKNFLAISR